VRGFLRCLWSPCEFWEGPLQSETLGSVQHGHTENDVCPVAVGSQGPGLHGTEGHVAVLEGHTECG
jgi:hypothetical protein